MRCTGWMLSGRVYLNYKQEPFEWNVSIFTNGKYDEIRFSCGKQELYGKSTSFECYSTHSWFHRNSDKSRARFV